MLATSPQRAYREISGWDDLLHLSPEAAANVIEIVTGCKILAVDAQESQRQARRSQSVGREIYETLCDFQRDSIGKSLGGGAGTTLLYKLIAGKRLE